jgi:hypothetical protein
MRASQATGNSTDAYKHFLLYDLHMKALGFEPIGPVPPEIGRRIEGDERPELYKFKAHRGDLYALNDQKAKEPPAKALEPVEKSELKKGDVVQFPGNPKPVHRYHAMPRYEVDENDQVSLVQDKAMYNRAAAGSVPDFQEPKLAARAIASGRPGTHNTYDYSHLLTPDAQQNGYSLMVNHTPGHFDNYIHAEILHGGKRVGTGSAYPSSEPSVQPFVIESSQHYPVVEANLEAMRGAIKNHQNWVKFAKSELEKAERTCQWRLGERRCKNSGSRKVGDRWFCHHHENHWANKIDQPKLRKSLEDLFKAITPEDLERLPPETQVLWDLYHELGGSATEHTAENPASKLRGFKPGLGTGSALTTGTCNYCGIPSRVFSLQLFDGPVSKGKGICQKCLNAWYNGEKSTNKAIENNRARTGRPEKTLKQMIHHNDEEISDETMAQTPVGKALKELHTLFPELRKGWPKNDKENKENYENNAVLQDLLQEQGREVELPARPQWDPSQGNYSPFDEHLRRAGFNHLLPAKGGPLALQSRIAELTQRGAPPEHIHQLKQVHRMWLKGGFAGSDGGQTTDSALADVDHETTEAKWYADNAKATRAGKRGVSSIPTGRKKKQYPPHAREAAVPKYQQWEEENKRINESSGDVENWLASEHGSLSLDSPDDRQSLVEGIVSRYNNSHNVTPEAAHRFVSQHDGRALDDPQDRSAVAGSLHEWLGGIRTSEQAKTPVQKALDQLHALFPELKKADPAALPLTPPPVQKPALHNSVDGFMGGLKALPKGSPERGRFITQHMNHAPFLAALKTHPQGQQIHTMLTQHLNSRANAGFKAGAAKVVAKSENPYSVFDYETWKWVPATPEIIADIKKADRERYPEPLPEVGNRDVQYIEHNGRRLVVLPDYRLTEVSEELKKYIRQKGGEESRPAERLGTHTEKED